MKKLFFIPLCMMAALCSNAQTIGFNGGMNYTKFGNKDLAQSYDGKIGYYAGLFTDFKASENINIRPSINFSMEGDKNNYELLGVKGYSKIDLGYVNIPVMVQYHTGGFFAEVGPQLGILALAKSTSQYGTAPKVTNNDKAGYKTINVGVGAGLGYMFTENIGLNARYVMGLSNIIDNASSKVTMGGLQAGLVYKLSK